MEQGRATNELCTLFENVLGQSPGSLEVLQHIDGFGVVDHAQTQESLRSHGIRLYNVARALEPATMAVLHMRVFAIRCMEAGRLAKRALLLCYVRTSLKAMELCNCREVNFKEGSHLALASFRRGFGILPLKDALKINSDDPSTATQEENDFSASVFHGAFTFTNLEVSEEDSALQRLQFLCDMWRTAMEILGTRVRPSFRRHTWLITRKLALLVYERGEHLEDGLALFEALEKWFPAATFDQEARLDDLVAMADMQIATGDRGLASVTLETASRLRQDLALDPHTTSTRLSWSLVVDPQEKGSGDQCHQGIQLVKEASVRVKLALAEVEALRPTEGASSKSHQSFEDACGSARNSFHLFLDALNIIRKGEAVSPAAQEKNQFETKEAEEAKEANEDENILVEKSHSERDDTFTRVWKLLKLVCMNYCETFGFDEETFRDTYLEAEACFGKATSAQRLSMRIEVLQSLPETTPSSMASLVLEDLASVEMNPADSLVLLSELWKRLTRQQRGQDVDGASTTARLLLNFCPHDDTACAYAHLVLTEYLTQRKAWRDALQHGEKASSQCRLFTPEAQARLSSLLFEIQMHIGDYQGAHASMQMLFANPSCSPAEIAHCGIIATDLGALPDLAKVLAHVQTRDVVWVHLTISVALSRIGLVPSEMAFEYSGEVGFTLSQDHTRIIEIVDSMLQSILYTGKHDDESNIKDKSIDWTPSATRSGEQIEASLLWIQAVTWRLAKDVLPHLRSTIRDQESCMRDNLEGMVYTVCAKASDALVSICDAPDDEESVLKARRAAAVDQAICSLADVVLDNVVGAFLGEPGLEVPEATAGSGVLDKRLRCSLEWLQQLAEPNSSVALIAQYLCSPTAPQFVLQSADKMAQFALFALSVGDDRGACQLLQQALQVELTRVHPSGPRMGRLLVLLVKYAETEEESLNWALQAAQIGEAHAEAYMTQVERRFLSTWLWNFAVSKYRACGEIDNEKGRQAKEHLECAIRILGHCPRAHEDHAKAETLRTRASKMRLCKVGDSKEIPQRENELCKSDDSLTRNSTFDNEKKPGEEESSERDIVLCKEGGEETGSRSEESSVVPTEESDNASEQGSLTLTNQDLNHEEEGGEP